MRPTEARVIDLVLEMGAVRGGGDGRGGHLKARPNPLGRNRLVDAAHADDGEEDLEGLVVGSEVRQRAVARIATRDRTARVPLGETDAEVPVASLVVDRL